MLPQLATHSRKNFISSVQVRTQAVKVPPAQSAVTFTKRSVLLGRDSGICPCNLKFLQVTSRQNQSVAILEDGMTHQELTRRDGQITHMITHVKGDCRSDGTGTKVKTVRKELRGQVSEFTHFQVHLT